MAKKQKVEQQEDLLQIEMSLIDKYKKPFIIGCVALLVIVAAVSGWKYFSEKSNLEAQEQLFPAQNYFKNGQYELALNGDSLGAKGFVEMAKGSTKAANLANLYAGLSYAKLAKWDDAVKYLEAYDVQDDNTVSVQALRALGNCYANQGNVDKAVSTLQKAAKQADGDALAPACLLEAGALLETQGKKAEARAIYESIKKDFPAQSGAIEKYLLRVAE